MFGRFYGPVFLCLFETQIYFGTIIKFFQTVGSGLKILLTSNLENWYTRKTLSLSVSPHDSSAIVRSSFVDSFSDFRRLSRWNH